MSVDIASPLIDTFSVVARPVIFVSRSPAVVATHSIVFPHELHPTARASPRGTITADRSRQCEWSCSRTSDWLSTLAYLQLLAPAPYPQPRRSRSSSCRPDAHGR